MLLATITANGNSTAVTPGDPGEFELTYFGTWDSGTIKLQQLQADGTTWLDLMSTVSANGRTTGQLYHKGNLRIVTASVATLAALSVYLNGVPGIGVTRTDNVAS